MVAGRVGRGDTPRVAWSSVARCRLRGAAGLRLRRRRAGRRGAGVSAANRPPAGAAVRAAIGCRQGVGVALAVALTLGSVCAARAQFTLGPPTNGQSMQTVTLAGRVVDGVDTPVGSATVSLFAWDGAPLGDGFTDSSGHFEFRTSHVGPYEIVVSTQSVSVSEEVDQPNPNVIVTLPLHSPVTSGGGPTVSLNDLRASPQARKRLNEAIRSYQQGDNAQAERRVEQAIAVAPDWGRPYYIRGLLRLRRRDFPAAQLDFQRASGYDPSNSAALTALGKLCRQTGQLDCAETALRAALALPPVHWQANIEMAQLDMARARYGEAEQRAQAAYAATPPGPIEALVLAGQAALFAGEWQRAIGHYRDYLARARSGSPATAFANRGLAVATAELRRAERADDAREPAGAAAHAEETVAAVAATRGCSVCGARPTAAAPVAGPLPRGADGSYHMQSVVDQVHMQVTVLDGTHHVVGGLPASDFTLYDSGARQGLQSVAYEEAPVSLGLLIDTSGSMQSHYGAVHRAAESIIAGLRPEDEMFVARFNSDFQLAAGFTSDPGRLRQAAAATASEGGTALYDAMVDGIDYLEAEAIRAERVLVVITDGDDDDSQHTLEQVLSLLEDPDAPIVYCVVLGTDEQVLHPQRRSMLATMAESTGGLAFFPLSNDEAGRFVKEIARTVRGQYTLTYTAHGFGDGFHPVHVEVQDAKRSGLIAITRSGYAEGALAGPAAAHR